MTLGALGLLRPIPTLLGLGAVGAYLGHAAWQHDGDRIVAPRGSLAGPTLMCLAVMVASLTVSLRLGFDAARTLHFESQHYRLAAVAHFREAGTIWTLPFQTRRGAWGQSGRAAATA